MISFFGITKSWKSFCYTFFENEKITNKQNFREHDFWRSQQYKEKTDSTKKSVNRVLISTFRLRIIYEMTSGRQSSHLKNFWEVYLSPTEMVQPNQIKNLHSSELENRQATQFSLLIHHEKRNHLRFVIWCKKAWLFGTI